MPFVQTMPIMRLGHCVPKVKLPSCQFPLYAYLALSMAFFGFKISILIIFPLPMRPKIHWVLALFEIFGPVRNKLLVTVSLDHPVVVYNS